MPTNGSSKRKQITEMFPPDELDADDLIADEPLNTGYVGFEMVVGSLITAAMQAQLRLFEAGSTLDTTTLERHFSVSCAPQDWPHPPALWAEISFYWPAEYTALSLYGDEALCDLYHSEAATCRHRNRHASLLTELEVEYLLPLDFVRRLDNDEGVERTARRIRQLFTDVVEHDNIVGVEAKALFAGDSLQLSSIKAGHVWVLEEEMNDSLALNTAFTEICKELKTVLVRFQQEFGNKQESPRARA